MSDSKRCHQRGVELTPEPEDGKEDSLPTPAEEHRFRVEISWNQNIDAYVARVPDIPELAAWDPAEEKALKKVRKAIRLNIEMAREYGDAVPEPTAGL